VIYCAISGFFKDANVGINYISADIADVFKFFTKSGGKAIVKHRFLNFCFFMA